MNKSVKTTIHVNERSEGGKLITYMNQLFSKNDWLFKSAVGELSVHSEDASDTRAKTLFPDIVLFEDKSNLRPIMGWELKMPDVSISDDELYSNAKDKADRMNTEAFVLWNFQYCRVFYKKSNGSWSKKPDREYRDYQSFLTDRKSVYKNTNFWESQLEKVLIDLNSDMKANKFNVAPISFNIGNYVNTISETLYPLIADYLLSIKDPILRSRIKTFAKEEQAELTTVHEELLKGKAGLEVATQAYAKNIIIRWINRFIFCGLVKNNFNGISEVMTGLITDRDIQKTGESFNNVVAHTDFYSVLHVDDDEMLLPDSVVDSLAEFCNYLENVDFSDQNGEFVSRVLEAIVQVTKRELMGLYTTPATLARLLVRLTMVRAEGDFGDFTVGSGTIVREIINELRDFDYSMNEIHNHVWASDKYQYPLQIANLNMTSNDSLNIKNIVFQHDALTLNTGDSINIVDPSSGKMEVLYLPKMNGIMSNLPFISSNNQAKVGRQATKEYQLNGKADLYQYLILHYKDLLSNSQNARIGVITSNSWLKNQKNGSFFDVLVNEFDIDKIVCSNVAKWFNNAKVVATILILAPKGTLKEKINLISLNQDIREENLEEVSSIADEILTDAKSASFDSYKYSVNEINGYLDTGLCLEALFDDLTWFKDIVNTPNLLVPITDICKIFRGMRTGRDKLFITKEIETSSEESFPYLKNMKQVSTYEIDHTDNYLFFTRYSLEELKSLGHERTIQHIEKISNLEDAQKQKEKHGKQWYFVEDNLKTADFVTTINPDKRYFWAGFKEKVAINQRTVAAEVKDKYIADKTVILALLNSVIPLFILCGAGFARADGVTDITTDGLQRMQILNPDYLDDAEKEAIIESWNLVSSKKIIDIRDQLNDSDWIGFNKVVLKAFGLSTDVYAKAKDAICKMVSRRSRIAKS